MPFILWSLCNRTLIQWNVEYIATVHIQYNIHSFILRFVDPFTLDFHTDIHTNTYSDDCEKARLWEGGENLLLDKLQQPNTIWINIICKQYNLECVYIVVGQAHCMWCVDNLQTNSLCIVCVCNCCALSIRSATFSF